MSLYWMEKQASDWQNIRMVNKQSKLTKIDDKMEDFNLRFFL